MSRTALSPIEIVAVVAIIAVLTALLLSVIPTPPGINRDVVCSREMEQLLNALQEYRDQHGQLPPAFTTDSDGNRLYSWRTLILPYLNERWLHEALDLSKPWNAPENLAEWNDTAWERGESWFQGMRDDLASGQTTYLAVVGPGCPMTVAGRSGFDEVTDRADQTIWVVDAPAARAVHWMEPADLTVDEVLAVFDDADPNRTRVFLAGFVDGRVEAINVDIPRDTLRAMLTLAAGDNADLD